MIVPQFNGTYFRIFSLQLFEIINFAEIQVFTNKNTRVSLL